MTRRTVRIRGKDVTFSSIRDEFGEIQYFRDGIEATSSYQIRVAKGVLAGKSFAEARGHLDLGKYDEKRLSNSEIEAQEEFHLGAWAEPPRNNKRGKERATYYIKVLVTSESKGSVGSPTGDGETCSPVTLVLRNPDTNEQHGFLFKEVAQNFERYALFTVQSYGMELCTENLRNDLIHVWRHSRR